MEISNLARYTASICVTGVMLVGCSGSQPTFGTPGSTQQVSAIASARTLTHRVLSASSYKLLHSFDGDPDGESPSASLDNLDGTLYGTTYDGGTLRVGCVYSTSTDGPAKVLHSFGRGSDGIWPYAGLIHVKDTLYGSTIEGGTSDKGTVYSISTAGAEKVLHSFAGGSDGAKPFGNLTEVDGTLYGTTRDGGPSDNGTVYVISTTGTEKVLHTFGGGSDGAKPIAGLTNVDGTLYGTTSKGGASDKGTVYSIGRDGTEKVLYSFGGGSDGAYPGASLTRVYSSTLYGTTDEGGTSNKGTVYSIDRDGTEKVLHSFGGESDGHRPFGGLIEVNGTLYGTTFQGGGKHCFGLGCGTVYSISTGGAEQVLYAFSGSDGAEPEARLLHDNGTLYGTTSKGGSYGRGTVFAFTL